MNFDDLIRAERDADALRLMAREMYDKGRIGQTRMLLMIRVADKYDLAKTDLEIVHGAKPYAHKVQDFLINLAKNEIVQGKEYNVRVPIEDGGDNSYIGLCVDVEDFGRKKPITSELRIFRHSNSVSRLLNTWKFNLGDICNPYMDNPGIPICFESFGVTISEAETEAATYFNEILRLIKKQTSNYRIQKAESMQEEREKLLARLNELGELNG